MQTPGVYIDEINSFPNSLVPVPTAIPAFVGYTPQASYKGKSYLNDPVKITSLEEFQAYFCYPDTSEAPAKQYAPSYYLVEDINTEPSAASVVIKGKSYKSLPDPGTVYYLFNSISAFFQNGGSEAYIVSIGTYGKETGKPAEQLNSMVNPNVKLDDLLLGVEKLKAIEEVTMYICSEATLLSEEENGKLMRSMLDQCEEMQTATAILDVLGSNDPDPIRYTDDIESFRKNTGSNGVKFGAAYFPFLNTTIMRNFDYTNLFGGDMDQLLPIISPKESPNAQAEHTIDLIKKGDLSITQGQNALSHASEVYKQVYAAALNAANVLPPSGFMAGIYTTVDNSEGVWMAPANITPIGASGLTIELSDEQQSTLRVDATHGKSVNCIRKLQGRGIVVWGARTLMGNSQDWRYVSVRRTITLIEQSSKVACRAYVFAPNDKNTWESVKAMISSFLSGLWQQGALQGATASSAFSVDVGLGTTMTSEDILQGFMNVTIKVAVTHPAEFIVITFQQQQATSS